jgi:hypothetical protein
MPSPETASYQLSKKISTEFNATDSNIKGVHIAIVRKEHSFQVHPSNKNIRTQ